MRKVATFEGFINGERFDNVESYNARITELVNSRAEDIQASSRTSIKNVEDELKYFPEDPDLSFHPYFDDTDGKYLDTLVFLDENLNMQSRSDTHNRLSKCYNYITDRLYSNDVKLHDKESYLSDIQGIINSIRQDDNDNNAALSNIKFRIETATAALEEAKNVFVTTINNCRHDEFVLNSAKPVINDMLDFYRRVEADIIQSIAEQKAALNSHDNCNSCTCDSECSEDTCCPDKEIITCNVTETIPQAIDNVESWYDRILHECGLR